ncbi:hypothetical protein BD770DRAFT_402710 [Pilaira anomala]|nr:hypothetical protein BD770DRAFT_402710 [Pilaira anomala]
MTLNSLCRITFFGLSIYRLSVKCVYFLLQHNSIPFFFFLVILYILTGLLGNE